MVTGLVAPDLVIRILAIRKAEGSRVGINTYYGMFREVFYTGKMQVGK